MAFENLKENLKDVDTNVRSYIANNQEYYHLKTFKILMKGITSLSKMFLIGAIVFLTLFILALAVSYAIGQALDNMVYGFAIVGVFLIVIGIIVYLLRDRLDKPLLKMFSNYYFDNNGNEKL